ncbi:MAG: hypothetical protein D6677_12150 [Calditrichaeota bacterium]|nr:MAG: hypothetical protein D6677_12150 [Calditrichota bacterium]
MTLENLKGLKEHLEENKMEFIFKNISHSYWFVIILAHIIWSQNTTDRAKPVPVLSDKHVLASYFPPVENHAPLNDRWREAGPPFMRTFTSEDYGDYYQFWKIARDDRTGLMYFLSQGVLLEYDGVTWREVTKKMSWNSQSLATDSTGRLWCASIHQVGFLEPDSTGFLKFQSLVQHIPAAIKDSTKLWKIAMTSRYVYFQSGRFLLRWSKNAHTMKSWRSATGFGIPHTMDDTFYIREKGVGLMRVDGDQLRVLPGSAHLSKMVISDIIPFSGSYDKPNNDRTTSRSHHSLLILTRTHGMFIYERGRFYTFNTEADVYLKQNRLECGAVLPDKSLALGTIHGGLMILSPEGKLRNILTKSEGLNDNTVYDILYDNRNGLWLALNKGIMRLEYPGPFSHFTEPAALKSSVNAIVRHKGKLYATTTDGVYTLEQSPRPGFPPVFRAISGLKAQTGRLLSAGGRLLIGSNKGVDELIPEDERTSAKEVRKVAQTGTPGCLVQSRLDSERVYVGLNNGVALLHLQSGKWQYTGSFAVGNDWIEGIAEENNKTLWLTTRDGVVYKITAPSLQPSTLLNKENILIQRFSKSNNLPPICVNPLIYKNKILFTTTKGIRYFDSPTQTFQIDSSLTELFADTSWYFNWIKLNFDQKGRIWTTRKDNIGLASRNAQGRYTWDETPFKYLSDLGGTWTFCIDPDYPGV